MKRNPTILIAALVVAALLFGVVMLVTGGDTDLPELAVELGDSAGGAAAATDLAFERTPDGAREDVVKEAPAATFGEAPLGVRLAGDGGLRGRVLDRGTGNPIPGARVELLGVPPVGRHLMERFFRLANLSRYSERTRPIAVVEADEAGAFVFTGVRAGTYFLDARADWWRAEAAVAARVTRSGSGGPVEVWALPCGRIAGRVVDDEGRGVDGARVTAFPGVGSFLTALRSGDARFYETRTGSDGSFTLGGVAPGDGYDLAASGRGMAISHAVGLTVRAGEDTEITVRARRGAVLTGRIVGAGPEGPIPIAGAQLGVVSRGLRDLIFAPEILSETHAETRSDGRFALHRVPPGQLDIIAFAPGWRPTRLGPRAVSDGAQLDLGDLELETGPQIRGIVRDSEGRPIPDVEVWWDPGRSMPDEFPQSFAPLLTQAVGGFEFPTTDSEGRFVAGPFELPGAESLVFTKPGYAVGFEEWDPEDEAELEVILTRGGSIEGIVMDAVEATPLSEFQVGVTGRLERGGGVPSVFNPFSGKDWFEDPQGKFRIEGVEAGTRGVTVWAPGYVAETRQDIEVVEGEVTRGVIVGLRRGGVVSGVVVDEEGGLIAGARVLATNGDGEVQGAAGLREVAQVFTAIGDVELGVGMGLLGAAVQTTSADGTFRLEGVEPGSVQVAAFHRDYAGGRSPAFELALEEPVGDVVIELKHGGSLWGRVTDPSDHPVPGAIVVAVSPGSMGGGRPATSTSAGGSLYQALADEDGYYEIAHVSGGSYFVSVTRGDAALNPASFMAHLNLDLVHLAEGQRLRHDVVDTSAGTCRVHGVVSYRGEPISTGMVAAMAQDSDTFLGFDFKMATLSSDGSYEFAGLAPGSYQFNVSGDGPDVKLEVEIPELPEHRLDLALPEAGLAGVVVSADTGEPVERAEVTLVSTDPFVAEGWLGGLIAGENRVLRDWTDETGVWSFERLSPGEYELQARGTVWGREAGRFGPSEVVLLEVEENSERSGISIALPSTLVLAGVVTDPGGAPVEGVILRAYLEGADDLRPSRARSDSSGEFELRGLAPGPHLVTAVHDDYADAWPERVEVGPATPRLELVLPRGVEVSVVVYDATGAPAAGAVGTLLQVGGSVAVQRERAEDSFEGFFGGEGASGADGRLSLGRHAPGTYRLEVQRGRDRAVVEEVRLEDEGSVEIPVHLR